MIDWSLAPKWAVGAAMDEDGEWFYFSAKPKRSTYIWRRTEDKDRFASIPNFESPPPAPNWRESWTPKPATTEPMTTEPTIEHLTLGGQAPATMPPIKLPVDDGDPAFPTLNGLKYNDGMSLRDYFAGQALIGRVHPDAEAIASTAYKVADAMLEARTK